MYTRSEELFKQACAVIPGGVNSPVRACRNVDCQPLFIRAGKGSHVVDVDGNEFIDFVLSWGPMILGHADEAVTRAIADAASRGTSYGAPTLLESELARLVKSVYPSIELVRMVKAVRMDKRELEAFFLSDWFRLACGLNGAHVLRILREEVLRRDRS